MTFREFLARELRISVQETQTNSRLAGGASKENPNVVGLTYQSLVQSVRACVLREILDEYDGRQSKE